MANFTHVPMHAAIAATIRGIGSTGGGSGSQPRAGRSLGERLFLAWIVTVFVLIVAMVGSLVVMTMVDATTKVGGTIAEKMMLPGRSSASLVVVYRTDAGQMDSQTVTPATYATHNVGDQIAFTVRDEQHWSQRLPLAIMAVAGVFFGLSLLIGTGVLFAWAWS